MSYAGESVNGIIFSEDKKKILFIKRRDVPVWVLPGGGIDQGETPEQAVLRELQEETGYQVEISRKVAEYSPKCRLARYTYFFEAQILSGTPTIGAETADIQFFSINNLPKRLPPPYPDWIQDACLFDHQTIKKEITSVTYLVLIKYLISHPILVIRFLLTKIGVRIHS